MTPEREKAHLLNLKRRINRARNFPNNTCPASRHVQMIGECLASGRKYHMIDEEPQTVAGSLLAVVECLFKARTSLARYEAMAAKVAGERK